jgi:monolysocardiolipin acyltransferase
MLKKFISRPIKILFPFAAAAAYFGRPWSSEEDDQDLSDFQERRLSSRGMYNADNKNPSGNVNNETVKCKKGDWYVDWIKAGDHDSNRLGFNAIIIHDGFMQIASSIVTTFTGFCSYSFITAFSDYDMYNYDKFTRAFYENQDRPLLTVGNHQSTVDDPVIISMIAPVRELTYDTRRLRWGLCAEEICFKNDVFSSFFGAGKVLPIKRKFYNPAKGDAKEKNAVTNKKNKREQQLNIVEAGISQKRFQAFTNKLRPGNWVHIFPEGRVCQQKLNVPNSDWKRSYLRWGVGKMIVQSFRMGHPPIVLPFFHNGLKDILPVDENDSLISNIPKIGKRVVINFDDPILYEDLIERYVKKYGALSKNPWNEKGNNNLPPTKAELQLYSDITMRIMKKLLELEEVTKRL